MNCCVNIGLIGALMLLLAVSTSAEEVGERWGTEKREREFYRVVTVPLPKGEVIEAGAFELMPDNRLAVGTRRGDIFFMNGVDDEKPQPQFTPLWKMLKKCLVPLWMKYILPRLGLI